MLLIWFGFTVAQQFRKQPQWLGAVDPGHALFPVSTYFAPNPAAEDIHLLVRHQLTDGATTPWREYPVIQRRSLRQMVWHPGRRAEKALLDLSSDLTSVLRGERREEFVQTSIPYLTLLSVVSHRCPAPEGAERVQFQLVASPGRERTEEPRSILASTFHNLPK
ncbi:hypothetical protein [Streptantibioticus parmotrematis]|uniref:hypothetical protein n=1 Tax=Streptantibioticus parmotrematis TaxID=2873249 RepID=UPI00207BF1B4|nr:hypothetical protein [Streptantibioticus parmotrematis]